MHEEEPSIIFAAESGAKSQWPDPVPTHIWEGSNYLHQLDAYMAELEPGQPVVIQAEPERALRLTEYTDALRHVSAAGRHVVIQIREE